MSFIIKLVNKKKITISILIVSSLLIYSLYKFIFWVYPDFIRNVYYNYACPTKEEEFSYNIGTFGDMYGGLNAFLSGLAFIGAVIAIILQVYQIDQDRRKIKGETIVQLNLFKWHLDKLKNLYLSKLKEKLELEKPNELKVKTVIYHYDFKDDYSFRELSKMSILDLYKGFVSINKKEQGDSLINFFQQLRHLNEDYKNVNVFISETKSNLIKLYEEAEKELVLLCKNIDDFEKISKLKSFGHNYYNIDKSDEELSELMKYVFRSDSYMGRVTSLHVENMAFKSSINDTIRRIEQAESIITLLVESIPDLNVKIV